MSEFNPNTPKELWDKPALELVWRGLAISISAGQMSRKHAMEMLESWDQEPDPPDNQEAELAA